MSFDCIQWAWSRVKTGGDSTMKVILVALAERAHDDGYTYPTIQELAHKAERSERTIIRKLLKLEEEGVIVVHRRRVSANLNRNSYTLQIDKSFKLKKGDNLSPNNMTECQQQGDTAVSPDQQRLVTTTDNNIFNTPDPDLKGFVTMQFGWKVSDKMLGFIKGTTAIPDEFILEQQVLFSLENADQRRRPGQFDNWFRVWVIRAWEKDKCKATPIPEGFEPDEHTMAMLMDSLIDPLDIKLYTDEFILFWRDNGKKKMSWQMVFYQQCMEQVKRGRF